MRGLLTVILFTLVCFQVKAQKGFAYTHITTEDGIGLAGNKVSALYRDDRGFIWVGTVNGLQRFDGSKFIQFRVGGANSDPMPYSEIAQIIPEDSSRLMLYFSSQREFGIFDPSTFIYKRIKLKTAKDLHPRAEFRIWKDSRGEIFLNIMRYGIMRYNRKTNVFEDDKEFYFPKGWSINHVAVFEDKIKNQFWFGCDSGICVYDRRSKQTWNRSYNPQHLGILDNRKLQDNVNQIYIDRNRRIWIFSWPSWGPGSQYRFCVDSAGNFLNHDTIGLNKGPTTYSEYNFVFEAQDGDLWVYGTNVLFNYDRANRRFVYQKTTEENRTSSMFFDYVFTMAEDKDHGLWIATDRGIYYKPSEEEKFPVANANLNTSAETLSLTDILEVKNRDLWLATWGNGVLTYDTLFNRKKNFVYNTPPPADWDNAAKTGIKLTWALCTESATGKIWIGCQTGILMIHNPSTKSTEYLRPPELKNSTVRYIAEDKKGQIWIGTQGGRLVKFSNNKFEVVQEVGTIIYKIMFDRDGWIWLATHEKGLYAIDPNNGHILQHYTKNDGKNGLFSNTGFDIEQLSNDVIIYAAGALNFVNKKTQQVKQMSYEEGLPSNTAVRLRVDKTGYLWIITSNGLCRYNPNNNRITPYGRKDGIVLGEQTNTADYVTESDKLVFVGGGSLLMFDPRAFLNRNIPPDVVITDFKLFDQFIPVDSLLRLKNAKFNFDQNSFNIYFASLSYSQKDKLAYYYKMEGVDKDWVKADRTYFVNYSLLPPGKYIFKVFCETLEGLRSANVTTLTIIIKPPFYRTFWFFSLMLFVVALLIYGAHNARVGRLMAVENLRNRVARDLHDDMGSTLSTINILSTMAIAKQNTDAVRTSEYLRKISENSQRMMEVMDDIVWSIKPSNDSMQKITARMREFATNVLEAKDMDFDFKVDEDLYDVKLNMEARRDFFLVFKEAVNNAAKYSKAEKVSMDVTMSHRKIVLCVKDNGAGFDMAEADGNGLGNMHKRADNLNGALTITSAKGEGTTVKLVVPIV